MSFFQFLIGNFSHVAPNVILGIFAVAIIAERSNALFKRYALKDDQAFLKEVSEALMEKGPEEARKVCSKAGNVPLVAIVDESLKRAHLPEEMIRDGVQIQMGRLAKLIQKRTNFLSTIANVATLIGLFGTIAGLISSFEAVAHADPQQKATLLSAGISTAMNATMLGLGIAIPCMIAYSFLMNRSNKLISDMEDASLVILDSIRARFVGGAVESVQEGKKIA